MDGATDSGATDSADGGAADGGATDSGTATTDTTLAGEETTTTVSGSGLGQGGNPSGGSNGIADTGHESMIGLSMVLAAVGLALRRLRLPSN